jgi:hypothetical protein
MSEAAAQLASSQDLLLNLAAVTLLGFFLRKYARTGKFALGVGAGGVLCLATSVFAIIPLREAFHSTNAPLEQRALLMVQELMFYGLGAAALLAIVFALLRRRARWAVAVPLAGSAAMAWVALDQSIGASEGIIADWALLVLLMVALIRATIAAVAPPERGAALARFGLIGACATLLLDWQWILPAFRGDAGFDILPTYTAIVALLLYVCAFMAWLAGGTSPGLVVFLRRFGKTELNQALARAARGRRGAKRFRMITLDDGDFVPVSANRSPVAIGAVILLALAALAYPVITFSNQAIDILALAAQSMEVVKGLVIGTAIVCAVPTVIFLAWAFCRSWIKRRKRILSGAQIGQLVKTLSKRPAWWLRARALSNPRAVVVTTPHGLWQQTVLELMGLAELVVLDLSDVSENVAWELDQLRERFPRKAVILLPATSSPPANSGDMRVVAYQSFAELKGLQISPPAGA